MTMAIPVETESPLVAVEVELPGEYELDRVTPQRGWEANTTRTASASRASRSPWGPS